MYRTGRNRLGLLLIPFFVLTVAVRAAEYDPLEVITADAGEMIDLAVEDKDRDREIPLRVYLPKATAAAPVVLFSHGLGGSRQNNGYMGEHWSARGYVVVFVQHPGSDEQVWKEAPLGQRLAKLRQAASAESFQSRVLDIPRAIDQLNDWNGEEGHPLYGRLNLDQLGMSGHSFGAMTTQAVGGQTYPLLGKKFTDTRIRAAVAFSPSTPRQGDTAKAFGSVNIPWLLMTGTLDGSPIGGQTPQTRLNVFPNLPPGDKFQVILDQAEHSAFGERALPGERNKRNPNHHRVILALSTAFWDAYLREDVAAKAWLTGDGPRTVLEAADQWETK
jgi:predicted dienelactone hydrolase